MGSHHKDFKAASAATGMDAESALHHASRHYLDAGTPYEHYEPAYRYGVNWYHSNPYRNFDDHEAELACGWTQARRGSPLDWHRAKPAVREAWYRTRDLAARAGLERSPASSTSSGAGKPGDP